MRAWDPSPSMVRDYDDAEIPAVYNMLEVPPAREATGFTQRLFRGLDLMVGCNVVEPDKEPAEPHSHPWEQINMVVDGEIDFLVGDDRISLGPFDIVEIPPGVEHTSRVSSDEPAYLLAFWPMREDRVEATDYQSEFPSE